jgi:hypothetical protein
LLRYFFSVLLSWILPTSFICWKFNLRLFYFRARQSLADVFHQISLAKLPSPQISFTGLSHFNNTVLYIDPVKDAHLDVLTRIAGMIISIFRSHLIIHSQKFVEKLMRKMVL